MFHVFRVPLSVCLYEESQWTPWTRGGQANFFFKVRQSEIRKFLGSFPYRKSAYYPRCASPQIANPQIFMNNPQIGMSQIYTKYRTTLSLNSPKSCLFETIFCTNLNNMAFIFDEFERVKVFCIFKCCPI